MIISIPIGIKSRYIYKGNALKLVAFMARNAHTVLQNTKIAQGESKFRTGMGKIK